MNLMTKTGIGLVTATLMMSCGKDKIHNAAEGVANTAKEYKIMGTWEGECKKSPIISTSKRAFYKFEGNDFIKATEFSANSDCTDPVARLQYEGTFKLADKNTPAENSRNLDLTYKKVVMAPLNQAGVVLLNTTIFCGFTDWTFNTKKDLTPQSVALLCPVENVSKMRYDIIKEDDNKLFFGVSDGEASTPDSRPQDLDKEESFTESKNKLNKD